MSPGRHNVIRGPLFCIALFLAACGGSGGADPPSTDPPVAPTLVSIAITPASADVPAGVNQQFTATGTYSDHSTTDLTSSVMWAAAAPATAKINASGLATGLAQGSTIITASEGSISGSAQLNVSTAVVVSIAISAYPAQPFDGGTLLSGVGLAWQLHAQETYSDGTTADVTNRAAWSSSTPAVATIDAATGLTEGVTLGSSTITAVVGTVTGTATLQIITGKWTSTSNYTGGSAPRAVLLPSGKVLVVCLGTDGMGAQIYDPSSGTWSTTGSLSVGRVSGETATLLQNGMVLVIGGVEVGAVSATSDVELYDPSSGTWSAAASLPGPLTDHTATLLPDGHVLVAGGASEGDDELLGNGTASTELYDPTIDSWVLTGALSTARTGHTATLLKSGLVLVAGGQTGTQATAAAELYDPTSGIWSQTGSLSVARALHTATLLADGRVLVTGGEPIPNNAGDGDWYLTSAEIYDPTDGIWTQTGSLPMGRIEFATTLLPTGKVLLAGGNTGYGATGGCTNTGSLLYDPGTGAWALTGYALATCSNSTTLLPNGIVLNVDPGGTAEWYW